MNRARRRGARTGRVGDAPGAAPRDPVPEGRVAGALPQVARHDLLRGVLLAERGHRHRVLQDARGDQPLAP
jgi:hypothetical protein